jgi:hypothetical protein
MVGDYDYLNREGRLAPFQQADWTVELQQFLVLRIPALKNADVQEIAIEVERMVKQKLQEVRYADSQ